MHIEELLSGILAQLTIANKHNAEMLKTMGAAPAATEVAEAPKAKAKAKAAPKADETPTITYDKVRELLMKVQKDKSKDALVNLLTEFKVKTGTELKADQYAGIAARAQEILTAEPAAEADEDGLL